MNQLTICEYVQNKSIRESLPYYSKEKKTLLNGKLVGDDELDLLYPINSEIINANDRTTGKGANPNKSQNFMHNIKSY